MLITSAVTKKLVEKVLNKNFLKSDKLILSTLDRIKDLGFYYATVSGMSISIEDLKASFKKEDLLVSSRNKVNDALDLWREGSISSDEKSVAVIKTWEELTGSLLYNITYYYTLLNKFNVCKVETTSGRSLYALR